MAAPSPVSLKNFLLAVVIGLVCLLIIGGGIGGVVYAGSHFSEAIETLDDENLPVSEGITPDKDRLKAAQRWRTLEGRGFTLYYPPGQNETEAVQFLHGMEATLPKVCATLQLKAPDGKISVFLFPDAASHGKVSLTEPDDNAYSYGDCITALYEPWPQMRGTMAHELGHVVAELRLADNVYGLIDEGLAEYVEGKVAGDTDEAHAAITSPMPLRALARSEIFYDWQIAEETNGSNLAHYDHAHSLVRYLIGRYGMTRFHEFYQRLNAQTNTSGTDEGQQLDEAVHQAFGLTLSELEKEWRKAAANAGY